jgi:hypothetical protein
MTKVNPFAPIFRIVAEPHPTLGTVYALLRNDQVLARFGSYDKAEARRHKEVQFWGYTDEIIKSRNQKPEPAAWE